MRHRSAGGGLALALLLCIIAPFVLPLLPLAGIVLLLYGIARIGGQEE